MSTNASAAATAPGKGGFPLELLVFDVTGMDCGDCAKSVERIVGQLPNIQRAEVSFGAATLTVEHDGGEESPTDAVVRAVGGAVDRAGYTAVLRTDVRGGQAGPAWWQHRRVIPTAGALLLWMIAFAVQHAFGEKSVAVPIYAIAIAIGGYAILRSAIASARARRIDMNVLMTISVIGAAVLGDWSEGALAVVLFSIGTFLQAMTLDRTRRAIRSLLDLAPEEAQVLRNGIDVTVTAASLVPGDIVRVRPGFRLPADGEIVSGHSSINQAAITGESMPVEREPGDEVFAGTMNGAGVLDVRVTKPSSSSVLANIIHLVEEAQASKAPTQQLVDRFAAYYTPTVVAGAALLAVVGALVSGDPGVWMYRALVLLVIACPCALVISTPVSIVSAIQSATRNGVLVKGGAALEEAGRVKTVVFDKTGTLTVGRPVVASVVAFGDLSDDKVLAIAAAVERPSEHPLARAVVARALHDNLAVQDCTDFEALLGRGAHAWVDGSEIAVGSERLLRESGLADDQLTAFREIAARGAESGQSTLGIVRKDGGQGQLLGAISVADRLRSGAAESIAALRREGVEHVVILTGDQEAVARSIADQVGADDVRAELLPDQKATVLDELRQRWGAIAMIGDGVNDAPALAKADVGIAMGIGGSDVALESASMALMRDDLSALAGVIGLSRRMLAIIRQNVTLSLITKVIAIALAMLGFVNLWIAVLVDVGTSLVVIMNGLRLAKIESAAPSAPLAEIHAHDEACSCGTDHHDHDHEHDHAGEQSRAA
ncbi:MAG: heavy metal translocating P-type ATPase [Thermomicrobiales bacterium]